MTVDNDAPQAQLDAQRQAIEHNLGCLALFIYLNVFYLIFIPLMLVLMMINSKEVTLRSVVVLLGFVAYLGVMIYGLRRRVLWSWRMAVGFVGLMLVLACVSIATGQASGSALGVIGWIAISIWLLRWLFRVRFLFGPNANNPFLSTDPSQIANTGEGSAPDDPR